MTFSFVVLFLFSLLSGKAIAASGAPFGYIFGRPFRGPMMGLCVAMGSIGGLLFVSQNASYRLMGARENAAEVKKARYRLDTFEQHSIKV